MHRRDLLRHLVWMGATVAFLPSCVYQQDQVSIQLKKIQINPEGEKFLKALAGAIIPEGDTSGAAAVGAHLFALKMVDDCFSQKDQQQFTAGMKSMQAFTRDHLSGNLETAAPQELVSLLEAAGKDDEDRQAFLRSYRQLVIQGYMQSEYVMTNLVPYKLIPGKYQGCVPLTPQPVKS